MSSIQLIRFAAGDGAIDPSFRGGGTIRASFVRRQDFVRRVVADTKALGLVIDPESRIIVAGSGVPVSFPPGIEGVRTFAVARFAPDGSEDDSFSSDGIALAPGVSQSGAQVGSSLAKSVTVDSAGRVVAAGFAGVSNGDGTFNQEFAVGRFRPDGTIDEKFNGGFVTTRFVVSQRKGEAAAIAIGPAGRLVATGTVTLSSGQFVLALARYRQTGVLDSTFSADGVLLTDVPLSNDESANGIAIDHLGRVVTASVLRLGQGRFGLTRYNANGSLDSSFGSGGTVTTELTGPNEGATCMTIDSQDRIVSAGFAQSENRFVFAVARHNSDGSLDSTFPGNGRYTISFSNLSGGVDAVAIDGNGRIVLAGVVGPAQSAIGQVAVVRLLPNGELDGSFGNGGRIVTDIQGGFSADGLGMATDSSNKIIVAATAAS